MKKMKSENKGIMDNLKEYIRQNRESFDEQEIPEGHVDRFEALLDSGSGQKRQERKQGERRGLIRRLAWTSVAVAAAMAGIIFINRPKVSTHDWFAGIGNDEFAICNAYYDKVAECYEVLLRKYPDGDMQNTIETITKETIPMIDQLPDEMDPDAKAAVLKEYYGDLLEGLDRIKNMK